MASASFKIGILEDDPDFRELLVSIVEADAELELAFACGTVAAALELFRVSVPDLVLVDMQLPDGSGLELIRAATAADTPSLMLTVLADRKTALAAFEEGVHGYLLKDSEPDVIHGGMKSTLSGQSPISPAVANHLLRLVRRAPSASTGVPQPTERETEVLGMIARGLTYAEVARAAGISIHTVGDHVKSIYRKLDVNSKNEAIHEARQLGWLGRFD